MTGFEPTDEQLRVLEHSPTRHGVLVAGPGTGKSATLVALIQDLAESDPQLRTRLVTFTRAATAELARKVSAHPSAAVERPSTIHSFAIGVLLRNEGAADFPEPLRLVDDWEYRHVIRTSLARRLGVGLRLLDALMREMEANWQALRREDEVDVGPELRSRFEGTWTEHRLVFGYTLLSELPRLLNDALRHHDDLAGVSYDLLVVDEYQDLNPCDLEVIERLAEAGSSILAGGDPDQSIYSFRKAAPEGIRNFTRNYPDADPYELTRSKRCAPQILAWARSVIEGDLSGGEDRVPLVSDEDSPDGEVALLAFRDHEAEAVGVASIIRHLVKEESVPPGEILVLHRGDRAGLFSSPIKQRLGTFAIPVADAELVARELDGDKNRRAIEVLRLLVNPEDSVAWASLLYLTAGVGPVFLDRAYEQAVRYRTTFGSTLLAQHAGGLEGVPRSVSEPVATLIDEVLAWVTAHPIPEETPEQGWGHWLLDQADDLTVPQISDELAGVILEMDGLTEAGESFARFLGQIQPLGTDLATTREDGVRFMTMTASKGLTATAAIVAGAEDGLIPRPAPADLSEERRLLYVAMTRARRFLYCTWARRRRGPTARAGAPKVGIRRSPSSFLAHSSIPSRDGAVFLQQRWPE